MGEREKGRGTEEYGGEPPVGECRPSGRVSPGATIACWFGLDSAVVSFYVDDLAAYVR